MRNLLLFIGLCLITSTSIGQTAKTKVPSYFGLQVKPILPTRFIGNPVLEQEQEGFSTTFSQKVGYSFGGVVRVGLTKLLALETGINYVERNFNIDFAVPDSNVVGSNDMSFISYSIPINGLVYIQLSEDWYMNTAIGVDLAYNPTNTEVKSFPTGQHIMHHIGLARKVNFGFNAEVGFEFRTKKKGIFYLGGIGYVPFSPLMYLRSTHQYQGYVNTIDPEAFGKVDGSYLSIEFKYFFPNIANKGPQFQRGPIE